MSPKEDALIHLALMETDPSPPAGVACECLQGRCKFSAPRVRLYLSALRQAQILREDPVAILRDRCRPSREEDPWSPRGTFDADDARDLLLAVTDASKRSGIPLDSRLAERLAQVLCPGRWCETR